MPERLVRFRQTFFDDLDSLLPDERGRDGRPSATDFLLYDLPRLRDQLAADFETNTLAVAGAEPLRVLIEAGTLVRVVAVYALSIPQVLVDQTTITRTTASGSVNVPTFSGGVYVEAIVSGVVQPFRYSSSGTGYRSYTVPHSGAVGNVVCVRANAYGYLTTSSPCATVR